MEFFSEILPSKHQLVIGYIALDRCDRALMMMKLQNLQLFIFLIDMFSLCRHLHGLLVSDLFVVFDGLVIAVESFHTGY